jgi:hypothetical protein
MSDLFHSLDASHAIAAPSDLRGCQRKQPTAMAACHQIVEVPHFSGSKRSASCLLTQHGLAAKVGFVAAQFA